MLRHQLAVALTDHRAGDLATYVRPTRGSMLALRVSAVVANILVYIWYALLDAKVRLS
jgi:hypothetical protein